MFRPDIKPTTFRTAFGMFELIFHVAVRSIRKNQSDAIVGLAINIFQMVLMIVVFFAMMHLMGMRGNAVRGDFVVYIMTGVFLFMTHTKTVGAVMGSEGPTSAIMKHAPMNTIVAILGASIGALYLQILSLVAVLFVYNAIWGPIHIEHPVGVLGMLMLSWVAGIGVGMVFSALKPWSANIGAVVTAIYMRINMIASGKMFLANQLPESVRQYFDWNPLFHTIDQARGFTFINYNPHFTSISYPLYVTLGLIVFGLMAEFYTRQYASASWAARM